MERIKQIAREMRGNALWDVAKWLILAGLAGISLLIVHITQRLRGVPRDTIVDIVIFLASVFFISVPSFLLWRKTKTLPEQLSAPPPAPVPVTDKPTTKCTDEWLHNIAKIDRTAINEFVAVEYASYTPYYLSEDIPYFEIILNIFNGSVYTLKIEEDVGGYIVFNKHKIPGEKELSRNFNSFPHGARGTIRIRHWIRKDIAEVIIKGRESKEGVFYLENLVVTISGEDVESKPLKLQ